MATDLHGNPLTASEAAGAAWAQAVDRRLRHDGGVLEAARSAVERDPSFALGHLLLGLVDPAADLLGCVAAARRCHAAEEWERSLSAFLEPYLLHGPWTAIEAGLRHARAFPTDVLGLSIAGTLLERSGPDDVHEAVLALYRPAQRLLGQDPYLMPLVGFTYQEQGRYDEAWALAELTLAASPRSTAAAHLRAHVAFETGEHRDGLGWLDGYRTDLASDSDYHHHLGWHAALHALALEQPEDVLDRLRLLGDPAATPMDQLQDTGTLLLRCRLLAWLSPEEDPTDGRAGRVPAQLRAGVSSMYEGYHVALGHAVRAERAALSDLQRWAEGSAVPGARQWLAVLAAGLAAWLDGQPSQAVDLLDSLRPTMYRWGGSHAQREAVEDVLIDAGLACGRVDLVRSILLERTGRRPSGQDRRRLAELAVATERTDRVE